MDSVTLLGGEELSPIQAGEQQSPSAVFYSATVGEDIQQPIVSYSVQYNQQYDCTLVVLHSLAFSMSKRRRRWKGSSDNVHVYTLRDSSAVAYISLE